MANASPSPPAASTPAQEPDPASVAEGSAETALLPLAQQEEDEDDEETEPLREPLPRLPVELDVSVAVKEFRVRNLLSLESGQVIEAQWGHGDDVPLSAGEVQLAWSEFEVVDSQLAVRITRLV